ncbi:predicted protein [Sclerotinia sclerotiorum 1980 UF-70]|uniref:Uncharacterized protein n=1 Tax=Sclerotinia sclerotiorum (strain ATCC 18683 / 1980 / Ss-1) TaxID=665079 RepID=A7EW44_SCLS1|nr:predicted protein [Sclerotinia sclerotiorum 1980 UF-70]EDN93686.1 predicted protein [Sclerotinia sclerotiorum 1980 UF-70]
MAFACDTEFSDGGFFDLEYGKMVMSGWLAYLPWNECTSPMRGIDYTTYYRSHHERLMTEASYMQNEIGADSLIGSVVLAM